MRDVLEVWLDCDLVPMQQIGTLSHDRGTVWFEYRAAWLNQSLAFQIDPELHLGDGPLYPHADSGNFGVLLDSAPDRWGQMLMRRKELLQAKDENRNPRKLYAWDFLQGVQDITRQGALRFRPPDDTQFVAHDARAVPPVTRLPELSDTAHALSSNDRDDLEHLRRWLAVLVAPGSSLGGARPKANFLEADGTVWIAKFPAAQDGRDVGSWEYLVWTLAQRAGVNMPPARKLKIGRSGYHTFCVQRFDRANRRRRFYASAMTQLATQKHDDGAHSYLDIAQCLADHGDPDFLQDDLEQLFRRVVFNVAVGNRDDHLRNHGFILSHGGWRLAPAFDLNPDPDKETHVLNLDESDNRPSVDHVRATAEYYRLKPSTAERIIQHVRSVVRDWDTLAVQQGLPAEERLETARAFEASL